MPLRRRRELLAWALGSRAVVVASAYLLHRLHRPQGYFPVQYDAFDSTAHVLGAWDGEWYRRIALHGYSFHAHEQSNTAFFPLYPLAIGSCTSSARIGCSPASSSRTPASSSPSSPSRR
jgi:hypothetical protein